MEKKLLVTVSEDKAAHFSVYFLAGFMERKSDFEITLFYTAPRATGPTSATTVEESLSLQRLDDFYINRGKRALAEAERELISFGFKKEQITQKLVVRQFGKIMDIIQEAEKGLYDAVLLGRRGLSLFDELFDQSVTKEILDHAITVPIWICRKPNNNNDIAVCFDGSDPSIRCLEHIMFMFKNEVKHSIVVLIVSDQETEIQELTSKIEDILDTTAFDKDRIHTKILKGRPAPSILKEIKDNPYGMVACGRSGKGRGLLGRILIGSVSYELYKSLRDITLCISR